MQNIQYLTYVIYTASNPLKIVEVRNVLLQKRADAVPTLDQVDTSRRLDETGDAIAAKASRELLSRGLVTTPKDTQKMGTYPLEQWGHM